MNERTDHQCGDANASSVRSDGFSMTEAAKSIGLSLGRFVRLVRQCELLPPPDMQDRRYSTLEPVWRAVDEMRRHNRWLDGTNLQHLHNRIMRLIERLPAHDQAVLASGLVHELRDQYDIEKAE